MRCLYALLFVAFFGLRNVAAIGEGVMDVNTFAGIIGGLGNMLQNNVETVNVSSDMLMGRWFQMYKAAINFDVFRTQMFCPVAYFKPNSVMGKDGFSMEEAYRVISKGGPIETYKRDVQKVGPGQFWMYTEEYFYPRQFYVIKTGPDANANDTEAYEYIIVTDSNRLALMVFARDPLDFFQNYNKDVLEYLEKNGFGGSVFWNSPRPIYQGPDCQWPSEKEVFARRVLKNQETNYRAKTSNTNPVEVVQNLQSVIQRPDQVGNVLQQITQGR